MRTDLLGEKKWWTPYTAVVLENYSAFLKFSKALQCTSQLLNFCCGIKTEMKLLAPTADLLWPGLCTAHSRSPSSVTTVSRAVDRLSSSAEGSTISIELQGQSITIRKHWTRFSRGQSPKVVNSPIKDTKGCSNWMLVDFQPLPFIHIHYRCACLSIDGDLWELSCREHGHDEKFCFIFNLYQ